MNGKLLHVKLNSNCYNSTVVMEKVKFRFLKTFCVLLNLNFPGERKLNKETARFHGNGPFCKIPTENQPIRVLNIA